MVLQQWPKHNLFNYLSTLEEICQGWRWWPQRRPNFNYWPGQSFYKGPESYIPSNVTHNTNVWRKTQYKTTKWLNYWRREGEKWLTLAIARVDLLGVGSHLSQDDVEERRRVDGEAAPIQQQQDGIPHFFATGRGWNRQSDVVNNSSKQSKRNKNIFLKYYVIWPYK